MTPVAATFKIVCNISAVDTQSGADNFPLLLDLLSNGGLVLLSAPVASLDAGTIASPLGDGASSGVYSRSSMLHIVSSAANKSAARLSRSSRYRCKSSASTLLLRLDRLSGYMLLGSEYGVDISTYIPYKQEKRMNLFDLDTENRETKSRIWICGGGKPANRCVWLNTSCIAAQLQL
jgi:hypothetical protein